jgi:hypothetical protein
MGVNDPMVFIAPEEGAFNRDLEYSRETKIDNTSMDLAGDGAGFSSADMVALMNNPDLLMGGSVKGSLLQGNNRDADGTIDRVAGPPPEMLPMLKKIKRLCDMEYIDLYSIFENMGGTKYGTMNKTRFFGTMKDVMAKIHVFEDKEFHDIAVAYGTGADDIHHKGEKEMIAWMDFCEDIGEIDASYTPADKAPPLTGSPGKPKQMSAQAMMEDAMDGKMDGKLDGGVSYAHTSLMGDKRWA